MAKKPKHAKRRAADEPKGGEGGEVAAAGQQDEAWEAFAAADRHMEQSIDARNRRTAAKGLPGLWPIRLIDRAEMDAIHADLEKQEAEAAERELAETRRRAAQRKSQQSELYDLAAANGVDGLDAQTDWIIVAAIKAGLRPAEVPDMIRKQPGIVLQMLRSDPPASESNAAVRHADVVKKCTLLAHGKIEIGERLIATSGAKADVIAALVELGAATERELVDRSGRSKPGRVLRAAIKAFPELSPYFSLPDSKTDGGFSTKIEKCKVRT
jgi:hypothetical protein